MKTIMILLTVSIGYKIIKADNDIFKPMVCLESAKVKKIIALRYRDAIIELDNGKTQTVNQATLDIGDEVCIKRGREL